MVGGDWDCRVGVDLDVVWVGLDAVDLRVLFRRVRMLCCNWIGFCRRERLRLSHRCMQASYIVAGYGGWK